MHSIYHGDDSAEEKKVELMSVVEFGLTSRHIHEALPRCKFSQPRLSDPHIAWARSS